MTAPAPSRNITAAISWKAIVRIVHLPLEPGADAEDEAHVTRALARLPRKIRGLAEFSFVDNADVGRELPAEFVAQSEAGIDVGEAGAGQAGRVRLAVNVELDLRLQDQPLRDQKIVGSFQLGAEMALAAHEAGQFQIEKIRGEALDAER